MKCEIIIDPACEERVLVYANGHSDLVERIRALAAESDCEWIGYREHRIVRFTPQDVYAFTIRGGRVYAVLENEQLQMKERLYTLEERLPTDFVKIHQSCIVNVRCIARFDASVAGTLKVFLKNGYVDYVSRRQMKTIKERLGI